ncbi:MAG: biotin-dependent carboxyltransferase family protein [Nocardioides sp.]
MITVLATGLLTTVQDLGRHGYAHLGVPTAGPVDAPAAALANRLVGNAETAALLETTLGGLRFRVDRAVTVAVTGAPCAVQVDGRARANALPITLPAGVEVSLGTPTSGMRSYVAFAGGIVVPAVLGSRATDTLSWTGPPVPQPGTRLPLGPSGHPRAVDAAPLSVPKFARLHPGPREGWCVDPIGALVTGTYVVSHDSDRIGVRLDGPALVRAHTRELASEGVILGGIQVPPDGHPLIFLHDHPVTGGYPVVAVVDPRDLALCAQTRPGERLLFARA